MKNKIGMNNIKYINILFSFISRNFNLRKTLSKVKTILYIFFCSFVGDSQYPNQAVPKEKWSVTLKLKPSDRFTKDILRN